jgi:hypothetical protein
MVHVMISTSWIYQSIATQITDRQQPRGGMGNVGKLILSILGEKDGGYSSPYA